MTNGSAAGRARDAFGLRYNPTGDITQVEVEREIIRMCNKLENLTDELAGRARVAAECNGNYRALRAQEFLKAEGTDAKRGAEADVKCHRLLLQREISAALYESTKAAIQSVQHQLDALRTLAANLRVQT